MKKIAIVGVFSLLLLVIGWQTYKLERSREALANEYIGVKSEYDHLTNDNKTLEDEIQFYADPHNLEKELRAKFNYILPGEKMIIVVPNSSSTGE